MRKFLAALLVTAAVTPSYAWDQTVMNRQVDRTNVLMNNNCSGTLLTANLVLTAGHCVEGRYEDRDVESVDEHGVVSHKTVRTLVPGTISALQFGPTGSEELRITVRYDVVKQDSASDLALVKLRQGVFPPQGAPVACQGPRRGDKVWAVGNPLVVLVDTLTTGIVSSVERNKGDLMRDPSNDHNLIQFTAPIAPGSSGGALYNDDGKLIGVNILAVLVPSGFNFAVTTDDVNKFLSDQGVKCQ